MNNENKTIYGIGVSGLVGSRIVELLTSYSFVKLGISGGVDITDIATLDTIDTDAPILLLAAKADVDGCEKDKEIDEKILAMTDGEKQKEEFKSKKTAWGVNVFGVENILEIAKRKGNKIVYVSTDFVFDGENTPKDGYREEDIAHPINWYASTKRKAEELITVSGLPFIILRIAYPYRRKFAEKQDFVRAIVGKLSKKEQILGVTDHIITPTFIDDIAFSLEKLLSVNAHGVYHVVGSTYITPFDAALLIAKRYSLDSSLISKTTRSLYFKDRAKRPFNLAMNNDKIRELGITPASFEEGLAKLL